MAAIESWPAAERPRERLRCRGPQALSDAELLALVVGSGVRGQSAVETCRTLLREVGGLAGLARRGVAELRTLRGIGPARAAALVAATELGWRLQGARVAPFSPLSRSERVYHTVLPRLGGRRQELFVVLALDSRHRLLSLTQVAQGSATGVEVHPREVFAPLVRESAVFAIVAHNHPSGDPSPSADDRELTGRLAAAGELLGIPLLDHLVIGDGCYVSLADRGEL